MSESRIHTFEQIPDILTIDIPPADYIVPALDIARGTVTLWTGADGDGKTFLAQTMAVAIAAGKGFLGMTCQQAPVLFIDLENPAHVVQSRMRMLAEDQTLDKLRVWGLWNSQPEPRLNDATLLQIAKQTKPIIIIDPFRFFHDAKENDSTEMTAVMLGLKGLASYGCAVVILHHPAKTEGSTGRGSSAIRGHSDLALLHSLDRESSLITLTIDKNRNGSNRKMTVRADFESGTFELTDSPSLAADKEKLTLIEGIIRSNPGVSQATICKSVGGKKAKCLELISKGVGSRWYVGDAKGPHNAKLYFIGQRPSVAPGTAGNNGNRSVEEGVAVPTVPCSYKGTGEQHTNRPKTLLSCKACGSHALYRDGSCMTCDNGGAQYV